MSTRAEIFLGIIAFASLATALVQIGVLVAAGLLARRLARLTERVEQDLKPVVAHLDTIGREAARAASLATKQVERVDLLFSDVVQRLDETMNTVQSAVTVPAREASALLAGLRAIIGSIRQARRPRGRNEDEDALFI